MKPRSSPVLPCLASTASIFILFALFQHVAAWDEPLSPESTATSETQQTGDTSGTAPRQLGEPAKKEAPSDAASQTQRSAPVVDQTPLDEEPQQAVTPEKPGVAERIHGGISKSILGTAEWLDSFFYDPRYAAEENRTRMIVRSDVFGEEDADWDLKTRLQIKLVLPQLKQKAHIIIGGDPDEQTVDQTTLPVNAAATAPDPNRNTSAALGYNFKSDERRNFNVRFGVRYRGGEIVTFFRPHYRINYEFDPWTLRLTQEFPYWSDTRWESLSVVDFEREFENKFFFRSSLVGHWYELQHGYFYSLLFILRQPLSPQRALEYEWINSFLTRPDNHLEETAVLVRYRQQFWRKWMFFEIAPQARFPRDRDFDLVPGILLRLEMIFGKY